MGSVGSYTQGWLAWMGSKANTNFNTPTVDSTFLGMGYLISSSAQNDEVSWDIWLDVGTWKYAQLHSKGVNRGIYSVQLDAVEQGTIDGYNGSNTVNDYSELTGISVTVAGLKTFKLKMATKNASSAAYYGLVNSCAWVRTSGTASTPGGSDTPGYTWHYLPWMGTKTGTGWSRTQNSGLLGGGRFDSSGTQNLEFTADIWLDTGTYKYAQIHHKDTNMGIHSIQLNAVEKGTVDAYVAGSTDNNYTEVTGITVATAGVNTFTNKMATKNGSSSSYVGQVQSCAWVRTGA